MKRTLNQMVERWLRRPLWQQLSLKQQTRKFISAMQQDGYGIFHTATFQKIVEDRARVEKTLGQEEGVRQAALVLLKGEATRPEVAFMLYEANAFEALEIFRKSKKLSWKALGFSDSQIERIQENL